MKLCRKMGMTKEIRKERAVFGTARVLDVLNEIY